MIAMPADTVAAISTEIEVLADLLARWLAGHCVPDDRFQTILMRGRILNEHMKIVRDLTKVTAMQMELEIMD